MEGELRFGEGERRRGEDEVADLREESVSVTALGAHKDPSGERKQDRQTRQPLHADALFLGSPTCPRIPTSNSASLPSTAPGS